MDVRGALQGGSLKRVLHYGDLENKISIGTAAAYVARSLFRESTPYYKSILNDEVIYYPTYHFLKEARRQFSGDVEDSRFSTVEENLYTKYLDYMSGTTYDSDSEVEALEALDMWFIDEIQHNTHPILDRDYGEEHKWNKTLEREL